MSQIRQKHLRFCQINCENLFVYMEHWKGQDLSNLTEREWQALSSSTTENKSLLKTRWLAEAVLDSGADILLLNEVGGRESLDNFNRHFLGNRFRVFLIEGNSSRGIDVGYLVRPELPFRYDLISHRQRPLNFLYPHEIEAQRHFKAAAPQKSLRTTHYFSRDALELRLYRDGSNQPGLIVFNVHLKSKRDAERVDPHGRMRRAAELKTLIEIYNERRLELPHIPIIVGGDFNGHARKEGCTEEFLPLYQNSDLLEVTDLAGIPPENSATQLQFLRSRPPQFLQIDYFFISPELKDRLVPEECRVYLYKSDLKVTMPYAKSLEQRNALPSDHYPIIATFKNFLE